MKKEEKTINESMPAPDKETEEMLAAIERLKNDEADDDDHFSGGSMKLRKILGGDILNGDVVRSQIWVMVLVVLFTVVYVAVRYQCQQDMIAIDKLENELKDAKYKALSSSSTLTEMCRESHILELLKDNNDSLLKAAEQPPYIITIPEE